VGNETLTQQVICGRAAGARRPTRPRAPRRRSPRSRDDRRARRTARDRA